MRDNIDYARDLALTLARNRWYFSSDLRSYDHCYQGQSNRNATKALFFLTNAVPPCRAHFPLSPQYPRRLLVYTDRRSRREESQLLARGGGDEALSIL